METALQRWQHELAGWALPERITSAVPDSPWAHPVAVFARRADLAGTAGPSYERAVQALAPAGTVLDVGAGAGAASLPLAPYLRGLYAVDTSEAMLEALGERVSVAGIETWTVLGRWPDVAKAVPSVDVVLCHHVFYNAPDLDTFALALNAHARKRVVVELPPRHPLVALNPLWRVLHDLDRPEGPTAEDAQAVLREVGIEATLERQPRPPRPEFSSFDDLVDMTRRRVCLPEERRDELVTALLDLGVDPEHPRELTALDDDLVTLWWDPS